MGVISIEKSSILFHHLRKVIKRALPSQFFIWTMFIVILYIFDPFKGFIIIVPIVEVVEMTFATYLRWIRFRPVAIV